MDTGNMTFLLGKASTAGTNASSSSEAINPLNVAIALFILVSSLMGAAVNGLFLWVLAVKMKRKVNTLWFLHLTLAYLISCSFMPLFAGYVLLDFHWIFGLLMCKLIISSFALGMFTTVFLLTTISLDRYLFTCHSVWSQHHRTMPRARRVITGVWLFSFALSAPYLAFQETQEVNGKIQCINHFAFLNNMNGSKIAVQVDHVQLAFFAIRFLLAFLIPFFIITACNYWVGREMKKKRLVRKTGKPFRVLVAAVTSFFICWLPYYVYYALLLVRGLSETVIHILWILMATGSCFNICFTPILYLFVGEKFQQVFKTSILTLLKKSFRDFPIPYEDGDSHTGEVDHRINSKSSFKMARSAIALKK